MRAARKLIFLEIDPAEPTGICEHGLFADNGAKNSRNPFRISASERRSGAALVSAQPDLLRHAIQIAVVIGDPSETQVIRQLLDSPLGEVAAGARACVFYLTKNRA